MSDIRTNASPEGKAWMKDYMDQHGLDPKNENMTARGGWDAAHLAEHADETPGSCVR